MMPGVRLTALVACCMAFSFARSAPLNDTGQITCYDSTAVPTGTVSSGTPAPESPGFEGQDCSRGTSAADVFGIQLKTGNASVTGRDYTKLDNSGAPLSDSVTTIGRGAGEWSCTRDNVTGLVWLLRTDDGGFGDRDHRYSFGSFDNSEGDTCEGQFGTGTQCSTDTVIAGANVLGLCGAQDWALPTPAQLESLFAYDNPGDPANLIDRSYFPDQVNDGMNPFYFWSQTQSDSETTPFIWIADFAFGWIGGYPADAAAFVRLVRAAPPPASPRFSLVEPGTSGQPVVLDEETGLMWKVCPEKEDPDNLANINTCAAPLKYMNWSDALTRAAASSYAGFDDWRLPNINELASIRDYSPVTFDTLAITGPFMDDTPTQPYWSSTNDPRASSLETALSYQFSGATAHLATLKAGGGGLAVRLVRGGNALAAYVAGAPSAPADAVATAGDSLATVSFTASSNDAGTPILNYTATSAPGNLSATCATSPCTVNNLVNGTAYTFTVRANNGRFSPPSTPTSEVVPQAAQAISFGPPPTVVAGGTGTVTATGGDSGNPVRFSSLTEDRCSVSGINGGTVTGVSVGLCTIAANQDGNAAFSAAPQVTQDFSVGVGEQTITFGPAPTGLAFGTTGAAVSATASSGLPVTYGTSTSEVCSIGTTSGAITILAPGTCGATANQPGDASFNAAPQATQEILIAKAPQTIQFAALADRALVLSPLALSAVGGDSGNPVQFDAQTTSVCTTGGSNGSTLTLVALGTCTIEASQAGNENYQDASPIVRSFEVVSGLSIEFMGTPRTTFSTTHNSRSLIASGSDHRLRIRAIGVASAAQLRLDAVLSTTQIPQVLATLATTDLIEIESGLFEAGVDFFGPGSPAINTVTYTVVDTIAPRSASQDIALEFKGNRPPKATYPEAVRIAPDAPLGELSVPGFASNADPGASYETGQTVSHELENQTNSLLLFLFDDIGMLSNIRMDGSTLRFSYDGVDRGCAFGTGCGAMPWRFVVYPKDDGPGDCGAGREGRDVESNCGAEHFFTIAFPGSNAATVKTERVAQSILKSDGQSPEKGDIAIRYLIRTINTGALILEGVRVRIAMPSQLSAASWTCSVPGGASCSPSSGIGNIDTLVDLELDQAAEITLDASLSPAANYVELQPQVSFAEGVGGTVFQPQSGQVDPVSTSFIHFGGFEGTPLTVRQGE